MDGAGTGTEECSSSWVQEDAFFHHLQCLKFCHKVHCHGQISAVALPQGKGALDSLATPIIHNPMSSLLWLSR